MLQKIAPPTAAEIEKMFLNNQLYNIKIKDVHANLKDSATIRKS